MKKVMKKILVFALVLAMVTSNGLTVLATENTGENQEVITCTGLEDCMATVHEAECLAGIVDEENDTDTDNGVAAVSEDGEDVAYVAKVGETSYATFEAALTAASGMPGDVTVEIYDKVILNSSLSGGFDTIKFVGNDTDAEIYLDVQGYITASGKKVAFEELILSKSAGGFITNAGFMNVAFGVYDVSEVTYTNCTFANGAYASSGNVTFTNCTFKRSNDKYGLWAYGNVNVTVDGCKFDDYRGIKMYAENAAKTVDLTVKNTNFAAVTDKPAIVLTYGESVTLENNTYSDTGTFELDLDGAPNGTAVTSDVAPTCKNDDGACGVLVDGKIYTTVAQAAEAATSGSTVTLLHDSTETVKFAGNITLDKNGFTANNVTVAECVAKIGNETYETLQGAIDAAYATGGEVTITLFKDVTEKIIINEKVGLYLTIDGSDKTVNGTITIKPLSDVNDNRRITIQNTNFVNTADTEVDFITASLKNHYPRLSVLNCDFTGNGKDTDVVAIRTRSAYDLIIKDCTGTGLHSFLQNAAGVKVTISNVKVTDSKGGLAMGTAQNVEISGCNLTTDNYGIRLDAEIDTSVTLNDNVVNAYIPVSVRKAKAKEYKVTLSGSASSYTATNTDGKWMAICETEYEDEDGKTLNEASGNVKLIWNTDVLDKDGVYGAYEWPILTVYSDGYTRGFDSLADAMNYSYSGGTQEKIVVNRDITESMSELRGNIVTENPNGVTIKNTIVDAWIYCGENFTIGEGVTYDATGFGSGLFMYAKDAVINGTVLTDCYYQRYEDTKLTINEPGSMTVKTETFILRYTDGDGEAGIYIVGDNNNETVGLDAAVIYFYQGCINAKDADIKVGTYWQTNTTDGTGSANLILDNSNMTVTVNEHNMKATGNSTVTLANGSNVNVARDYEGVAVFVDEASTFSKGEETSPVFIARVGNVYCLTLELAIEVADGETITILDDITLSDAITISDKQVLDLNGKTLNGNIVVAESGDVTIMNGSIVNVNPNVSAIETVGTLTLTDVEVESARHAVRVEGGTTTINSGYYRVYGTAGMTTHALNVGGDSSEAKVIINGGVFVGPADTGADSGAAINVQKMATVEIKDGAFVGGKIKTLTSAGELIVSGGCFDQEVSAEYLAEGKTCAKGTYIYEGNEYFYAVKDEEVLKSVVDIGIGENETRLDGNFTTQISGKLEEIAESLHVERNALLSSADTIRNTLAANAETEKTSKEKLEAAGISTEGKVVTTLVKTYMQIVMKEYNEDAVNEVDKTIIGFDLVMLYDVVATTDPSDQNADNTVIVSKGNIVEKPEATRIYFNILKDMIDRDNDLVAKDRVLYVEHLKADGSVYNNEAELDEDELLNGTEIFVVSFYNDKGYSTFNLKIAEKVVPEDKPFQPTGGNTSNSGSSNESSIDKDDSKEPVEVHYSKSTAQTVSAKTGDASNVILWVCVMGVALVVMAALAKRKRTEK